MLYESQYLIIDNNSKYFTYGPDGTVVYTYDPSEAKLFDTYNDAASAWDAYSYKGGNSLFDMVYVRKMTENEIRHKDAAAQERFLATKRANEQLEATRKRQAELEQLRKKAQEVSSSRFARFKSPQEVVVELRQSAFDEYMDLSQEIEDRQSSYINSLSEQEFCEQLLEVINSSDIRDSMKFAMLRESLIQRMM